MLSVGRRLLHCHGHPNLLVVPEAGAHLRSSRTEHMTTDCSGRESEKPRPVSWGLPKRQEESEKVRGICELDPLENQAHSGVVWAGPADRRKREVKLAMGL